MLSSSRGETVRGFDRAVTSASQTRPVPDIELLYWDGCPSHPEALELLESVLAARGIEARVALQRVETQDEAVARQFPGSPTIRIDGRDVDPAGAGARPSLTCRIYRRPNGTVSPVPSKEQIEMALNTTLPLGSPAPAFELPGVDGESHALGDYAAADALVLIQSCNHCPYVLAWEGRIARIASDYADRGVSVVAICSNDGESHPEDSFPAMVQHAKEQAFPFDYLHDEEQALARVLGSERTPEVFVFNRDRALVYHGAVDDSREEDGVQTQYLRDALDATLGGRAPAVAETAPQGCTVKWRS
jgi:peroxiredoxin